MFIEKTCTGVSKEWVNSNQSSNFWQVEIRCCETGAGERRATVERIACLTKSFQIISSVGCDLSPASKSRRDAGATFAFLPHQHAAIDVENVAGNVAGFVGRKKSDGARDIFGRSNAAKGDHLQR